jgi:hypothetical protein
VYEEFDESGRSESKIRSKWKTTLPTLMGNGRDVMDVSRYVYVAAHESRNRTISIQNTTGREAGCKKNIVRFSLTNESNKYGSVIGLKQ